MAEHETEKENIKVILLVRSVDARTVEWLRKKIYTFLSLFVYVVSVLFSGGK